MLKLTQHLFTWEPRAEYADYYERALYNHILASQNPINGMMCYFLPLANGPKEYCTQEDSFWCCTGTGIENHAKYGDSIYFHQGETGLFVNLFIASELRWPAAGIVLRQETKYPDEGRTRFVFACEKPVELRLHVRHPFWAISGFELKVNGTIQSDSSGPGSYATIARTWKDGDIVEVTMPFSLRTEAFRDNPHRVAVMYGPLVLCAETEPGRRNDVPFPALVVEGDNLASSLQPVSGKPCNFRGSSQVLRLAGSDKSGATLEPIHTMHGNRTYVVYWNAYTPEAWRTIETGYLALEARVVDRVMPGNEQSERNHREQGDKSGTDGKSWRDASDGGWFSWDLKVRGGQPQQLRVKYWGSDTGARDFDLVADGRRLATVKLDNNKPGEFYEESYSVPVELTRGKEQITVRFQAHPGKMAGGVFGCAVLTRDQSDPDARAKTTDTKSDTAP
jgi:hypothetical protein